MYLVFWIFRLLHWKTRQKSWGRAAVFDHVIVWPVDKRKSELINQILKNREHTAAVSTLDSLQVNVKTQFNYSLFIQSVRLLLSLDCSFYTVCRTSVWSSDLSVRTLTNAVDVCRRVSRSKTRSAHKSLLTLIEFLLSVLFPSGQWLISVPYHGLFSKSRRGCAPSFTVCRIIQWDFSACVQSLSLHFPADTALTHTQYDAPWVWQALLTSHV